MNFLITDEQQIRQEKNKARALRQTQWWKNQIGKNHCYYCKKEIPSQELTMDHLIPISRGGKSTKKNVVPCCKDCNNQKKHFLPHEWDPNNSEN